MSSNLKFPSAVDKAFFSVFRRYTLAFSIGSDSKVHDESKDAAYFAAKIGCDFHLNKMVSKDASSILVESMNQLHEPFADYSLIPTFALTKTSKEHCTVMLSGDGGDELFFGYERFYAILKKNHI